MTCHSVVTSLGSRERSIEYPVFWVPVTRPEITSTQTAVELPGSWGHKCPGGLGGVPDGGGEQRTLSKLSIHRGVTANTSQAQHSQGGDGEHWPGSTLTGSHCKFICSNVVSRATVGGRKATLPPTLAVPHSVLRAYPPQGHLRAHRSICSLR